MKNNNQNINSVEDLISVLQSFDNKTDRDSFVDHVKKTKADNDALIGTILFLEDHDWDFSILAGAFSSLDQKILKTIQGEKEKRIFPPFLKYAAGIFIILGLASILLLQLTSNSPIDQFYPEEPGLPNFLNANSPLNKWQEVMSAYYIGDFKQAHEKLQQIKINEPQNDTVLYYDGVISYQLNEYQSAVLSFMALANRNASVFFYDASFRLGFSLFKNHQLSEAQNQFKMIAAETDHPYTKESAEILSELF